MEGYLCITVILCLFGVSEGRIKCRYLSSSIEPDPSSCDRYLLCDNGAPSVMRCPDGLLFNPQSLSCDFSGNVVCRNSSSSKTRSLKNAYSKQAPFVPPSMQMPVPPPPSPSNPIPGSNKVKGEGPDVRPLVPLIADYLMKNVPAIQTQFIAQIEMEAQVLTSSRVESRATPFNAVQSFFGSLGPAQGLSLVARLEIEILERLMAEFSLTREEMIALYPILPPIFPPPPPGQMFVPNQLPETFDVFACPVPMSNTASLCDSEKRYREIDGSCNNLEHPLWGRAFRPLNRFLAPDYADGISKPRVGLNGNPLPSARLVSVQLFTGLEVTSPVHTVATMVFGQFIDHDTGRTAISTLSTNSSGVGDTVAVQCGASECETEGPENAACFPILIDPSDPVFGAQPCLKFVRTQETPIDACRLNPREQLNQITSYLDASNVYGSTLEEMETLRDLSNTQRGQMAVTPNADPELKPLLPQTTADASCDGTTTETIQCFAAGDERVNEQIGLTAMHTIWVRYHNYLEQRLHLINPLWNGERLYQETRRILIAVWQYIIYNEFVPMVVGPQRAQMYNLNIKKPSDYSGYDDTIRVDVSNVFQTAAFRFGHSLVPTTIGLSSNNFGNEGSLFLSQGFSRPTQLYNNAGPADSGVDSLVFAQISQAANKVDNLFTEQITQHLFTTDPPFGLGLDLPALNIQRGRDHGIAGYIHWRKWCQLSVPTNFNELTDIPESIRSKFEMLYIDVEDIDLFAGAISETPVSGGLVGPTFACIIARQFRNLRVADRFWFERQGVSTGFTDDQISEIRRVTLSKVMCHTLDNVKTIQKHVLIQPFSTFLQNLGYRHGELYHFLRLYHGDWNERRPCSHLPDLDLNKWVEQVIPFVYNPIVYSSPLVHSYIYRS